MAGRSEVTVVKLSGDLVWEPAANLTVRRTKKIAYQTSRKAS